MRRAYRIYVSGPISKGDQAANVRRAIEVGTRLQAAGLAPFVPHTSWLWEIVRPMSHSAWIAINLPWVDVSDALIRLSGESVGSDIEVTHAEEVGIPVFQGMPDGDLCHAVTQYFEAKDACRT